MAENRLFDLITIMITARGIDLEYRPADPAIAPPAKQ
jgi:hypothetical protein